MVGGDELCREGEAHGDMGELCAEMDVGGIGEKDVVEVEGGGDDEHIAYGLHGNNGLGEGEGEEWWRPGIGGRSDACGVREGEGVGGGGEDDVVGVVVAFVDVGDGL